MEGDPLADVLSLASARCVRIGTLKAGGAWALRFPPPFEKSARLFTDAAGHHAQPDRSAPRQKTARAPPRSPSRRMRANTAPCSSCGTCQRLSESGCSPFRSVRPFAQSTSVSSGWVSQRRSFGKRLSCQSLHRIRDYSSRWQTKTPLADFRSLPPTSNREAEMQSQLETMLGCSCARNKCQFQRVDSSVEVVLWRVPTPGGGLTSGA
jgi:hypothetical protein